VEDNMKIGYVRVSTAEQNTMRQEVMLHELGVEEIFIDTASGMNTDRPELKKMLAFI
jgi:DNA invertase Pin-like site-specific DNA recombinase